ncbi:putative glutamate-1-semialdehyde 2,1-aminomutase [Clohesyomyces aquaticus]|uniref:Putative glutamate-1-semialdehyde 2,1-aminomutase n=1 Tax=Clohesyomyces aquaticus TaxID=1231657 RepID=A0A1Y1ZJH3_9PLEO|nr:putative glutamate-1-semialdehyde 2,1-aminomutase [Clohesyomyces aquaticus]
METGGEPLAFMTAKRRSCDNTHPNCFVDRTHQFSGTPVTSRFKMPTGTTVDALKGTKSPRLADALQSARTNFTNANPRSFQSHLQATKFFPGGNTRTLLHSLPFPLTFKAAHSCYLTSLDDGTYVDFCGEYTSGIFGHNHPTIKEAIETVLQTGWNYGGINDRESELARMVCERFKLDLVRFTNTGTEASIMAIGAALAYTGRKSVLVFSDGFHGNVINFPVPRPEKSVVLPHQFIIAPFNDISGTDQVVLYQPADSLAAILVEPVQGAGGAIPATSSFLQYLRNLANSTGAVLIIDETMTSRLSYHGQARKMGVQPDLMTLGKWIGGGMTFGAFGGKGRIMEMFDQDNGILAHSGTFNNNVFSMTTGIAGMKIYSEEEVERLNGIGNGMITRLKKLLEQYGVTGHPCDENAKGINEVCPSIRLPRMYVSGVGGMLAVHFSGPEARILKSLFFHHLLQHDIYIASRGFISLCLDITEEHVTKFVEAFEKFACLFQDDLRFCWI